VLLIIRVVYEIFVCLQFYVKSHHIYFVCLHCSPEDVWIVSCRLKRFCYIWLYYVYLCCVYIFFVITTIAVLLHFSKEPQMLSVLLIVLS